MAPEHSHHGIPDRDSGVPGTPNPDARQDETTTSPNDGTSPGPDAGSSSRTSPRTRDTCQRREQTKKERSDGKVKVGQTSSTNGPEASISRTSRGHTTAQNPYPGSPTGTGTGETGDTKGRSSTRDLNQSSLLLEARGATPKRGPTQGPTSSASSSP